jgi:DNA-binding PadR family transcriptional regulator
VVLPRQVARCLRYVAEHPGASSVEVQHGVGIRHPSQISRVLSRLERDGFMLTLRDRRSLNAWTVTDRGSAVLAELPEAIYE